MKPGTMVTFVNGGESAQATVTDVVGTGESTFKVVDLDVSGEAVEAVYHASDVPDRYWTLEPVAEKPKKRRTSGGRAKATASLGVKKGEE